MLRNLKGETVLLFCSSVSLSYRIFLEMDITFIKHLQASASTVTCWHFDGILAAWRHELKCPLLDKSELRVKNLGLVHFDIFLILLGGRKYVDVISYLISFMSSQLWSQILSRHDSRLMTNFEALGLLKKKRSLKIPSPSHTLLTFNRCTVIASRCQHHAVVH